MTQESFPNLPNFRQVGGGGLVNEKGRNVKDNLVYRSSRTDFLSEEEVKCFTKMGFKSIIDMRNKSEFERADGLKLLNYHYEPVVLKGGNCKPLKPSFRWGGKLKKVMTEMKRRTACRSDCAWTGKRYITNILTRDLILHVFHKLNFIVRYASLLLLAIDWFIGCHLFTAFFAWAVLNRQSLVDQYMDILEYGKPAVRDILELVSDERNLPAIIHCAHGKDRTGIIVAVMLACIEVSEEDIIRDYAQSEVGLAPIKDRVAQEISKYGFHKKFTMAEAQSMHEVSQKIKNRYGSWANYIESTGFTKENQERLKEALLVKKDN